MPHIRAAANLVGLEYFDVVVKDFEECLAVQMLDLIGVGNALRPAMGSLQYIICVDAFDIGAAPEI